MLSNNAIAMKPVDFARLRSVCREYPRDSVAAAVLEAIESSISCEAERRDLSALIAAWLCSDDASDDAPPLTPDAGEDVLRTLRKAAH
jgi:hypothetical protein